MSHHVHHGHATVSPKVWHNDELRALGAIRVGLCEIVYAYVSLEGDPRLEDEALLDSMEQRRASRFVRRTDRHRYVLAHAALRSFLAACLGTDPATVGYDKGRSGKPRLAAGLGPLEFNLSHSEQLALVAAARRRAVGVDVERVRDVPEALGIAGAYFSAQEKEELDSMPPSRQREAFLRCWSRKEAMTKATGEGLGSVDGRQRGGGDGWDLRDLPSPRGYVAAGAAETAAGVRDGWRELSG